jgi:hypothetical protein
VSAGAVGASRDGFLQHSLHRPEISDLRLDILQMLVGEPKQRADLFDRKAEGAGAADEAQSLRMIGPIQTVAASAPGRSREQSDPLVIANRFDVRAGLLREAPNGERF